MSDPGAPSDNTTLSAILADLEEKGWRGQFAARPGAMVRCFSCQADHPAAELPVEGIRRTEGASDPADMLAISTVTCPACGARGILTLNYGPDGSADDTDVLVALRDERRGGEVSSTQ
ncbi:MAG: hypothetical protein NVS3B12_00240 [Acidimicrobiales bacterium]